MVLGKLASAEGFPAHVSALSDPDPVVRSYAARALGRLATKPALTALRDRLRDRLREEAHESVRRELLAALQKPSGPKSPIW